MKAWALTVAFSLLPLVFDSYLTAILSFDLVVAAAERKERNARNAARRADDFPPFSQISAKIRLKI